MKTATQNEMFFLIQQQWKDDKMTTVCGRFEPPFYRQPPIWPYPPYIFFPNPLLYQANIKINLWGKIISSSLEDNKTMLSALLNMEQFFIQHQAKIYSK